MPQGIPLDQAILDKHLEIYHDLHANPELSMQEQRTAEVITRVVRAGTRAAMAAVLSQLGN